MSVALDSVATSFIDSNLLPGQQTAGSPFQFIGVRPFCTIEEVEKRTRELRSKFHPDRLDEKLEKYLGLTYRIPFSVEDWTSHFIACCM
jgi:hypothetical protein